MGLGFGAALFMLGGGSEHGASEYYGKKIEKAVFEGEGIKLTFDDGVSIVISDEGQSCCEHRYMTTDDDVKKLEGKILTKIELKSGPDTNDEYGNVHEQMFLELTADFITVAFCSHNEHNGYYGGICLNIREVTSETN